MHCYSQEYIISFPLYQKSYLSAALADEVGRIKADLYDYSYTTVTH